MAQQRLSDVLSGPEKWVQHCYTINDKGERLTRLLACDVRAMTCFCLQGAAVVASGQMQSNHPVNVEYEIAARLRATIAAAGFGQVARATSWNDDPARTFDDIRKVAAKYDEMYPVS